MDPNRFDPLPEGTVAASQGGAGQTAQDTAGERHSRGRQREATHKDAPASEFDLVFNCDHLGDPRLAADLVARCFRKKFGTEVE